jgi:enamine deaminase RidA (YjgF/YER057c/UK114 family)
MLATAILGLALAGKKNADDETQTLELPKDPPMVAIGETSHLIFNVSPLSAKGLLSQQTREALKAILKANGGAQVVHIRAFIAGSGDIRRVPQIVSEVFTGKKMQLPSVSVIQAGALPLENAQIVIEAVSAGKKEVNPDGLAFIEAESLDQLSVRLAGSTALKVSCFASSFSGANAIAARFPSASVNLVQTQRTPARNGTSCEAVVRGGSSKWPRLAFTGTQVAFGADEKAAILAFRRLDRELSAAGVQTPDIVEMHVYSLSERLGELARKVRTSPGEFTVIPFEGVASVDGTFAVDAIAALSR